MARFRVTFEYDDDEGNYGGFIPFSSCINCPASLFGDDGRTGCLIGGGLGRDESELDGDTRPEFCPITSVEIVGVTCVSLDDAKEKGLVSENIVSERPVEVKDLKGIDANANVTDAGGDKE
jgi:hypothetical protein